MMKKNGISIHIGCGNIILRGWINVDLTPAPGIDKALDVRKGLPFNENSVLNIYAEHFIEHLTPSEGEAFLRECRRILLREQGVLRVSTPNLDWVWMTHYRWPADDDQKRANCEMTNRAFYGWGHKHLYNDTVLSDVLRKVGFREIKYFKYGESERACFQNIEHHEKSPDLEHLPHVIIAQAYK